MNSIFVSRRQLSLFCVNPINKIKRFDLPKCRNCKYFKPDKSFKSEKSQIQFGQCTYFGEKNLVSGEIQYPFASTARVYECGEYGKYYSPKEIIESTDI